MKGTKEILVFSSPLRIIPLFECFSEVISDLPHAFETKVNLNKGSRQEAVKGWLDTVF